MFRSTESEFELHQMRRSAPLLLVVLGCLLAGLPAFALGPSPSLSIAAGELRNIDGGCAETLGGATADGTPVVLGECNGQENQKWEVLHDGRILGPEGKCLSFTGSIAVGIQPAVLNTCSSGYVPWLRRGSFPSAFSLRFIQSCLDVLETSPAEGRPIVVAPCAGEASQLWSFPAAPQELLLLPNFRFSTEGPDAHTTLFALRNAADGRMAVRILYSRINATSRHFFAENLVLEPKALYTANLRHVPGLAADLRNAGFLEIGAYHPDTLEPWPNPPLYGDYFRLNPEQNSATGALLTPTGNGSSRETPTLCNRWDTRFLHGGGFGGRTLFYLHSTALSFLARGDVHGHDGTFLGSFHVNASQAGIRNSASLELFGASSGTIEWTLQDGALGHISTTYLAAGRYSASLPGHCRDQ